MLSELWSLTFLPFKHFTTTFIGVVVPFGVFMSYKYHKSLQATKQILSSLPEMDMLLSEQIPMEESQKLLVQMVLTLKAQAPTTHNLKKIGFCYNDSGSCANSINTIKIGSQYTLLVGQNLLERLEDNEKEQY